MSTSLRHYTRGYDQVTLHGGLASTHYYHYDHQGTTQCLTDDVGTPIDRFSSDAWGVEVSRSGNSINRQWYVGRSGYYKSFDHSTYYSGVVYFSAPVGRSLADTSVVSARTAASYQYMGNRPTPSLLPEEPNRRPYRVIIEPDPSLASKPILLKPCGGAGWRISWGIRDAQGKPVDYGKVSLKGYIIQKVTVSGVAVSCDPNRDISFPDGCTYYEAWEVDYSNTDGLKVRVPLRDDIFGWGGSERPSQGGWTVHGEAAFIEGYQLIMKEAGGTWSKNPNLGALFKECAGWSAGILKVTQDKPKGWDEAPKVSRTLSMDWRCPCPGNECKCTSIVGSGLIGGRMRRFDVPECAAQ